MSETFVKRRADAPPKFFAWEAAGLAWLAEATPDGGVAVAGVREVDRTRITLERIRPATPTHAAAEDFGRSLAATHGRGAAAFGVAPPGWSGDGWIGRQSLPIGSFDRWGAFYGITRLQPYARAAHAIGNLSDGALRAVDLVCDRLAAGEFDDDDPPARIHGDLWGGNVLYRVDGAVLIDPAAHGGHRLTDLAMLALFGTEHLPRVLAAYAQAARLRPDWPDLIGLHQLHPLLVHAVTHGAGYGRRAGELAARYT